MDAVFLGGSKGWQDVAGKVKGHINKCVFEECELAIFFDSLLQKLLKS